MEIKEVKYNEYYEKEINNLYTFIEKCEDDFENKITYVSAGALGFAINFLEKSGDSFCTFPLKCCIALFFISLLSGTLAPYIISRMAIKIKGHIHKAKDDGVQQDFTKNTKTLTKWSNLSNKLTIYCLFIGAFIFSIYLFFKY